MYHPSMRLKSFHLPNSGPLLAAGYVLLWLLLWPTVQPFWMLPYGLRFGALLLTPIRHWGWLLGAELAASAGISVAHGLPLGWSGFAIGELPEPLVMAASLWLLRRFNLHASLHSPQEVTRLLLSVVLVVTATTAVDAALPTMIHSPNSPDLMLRVLGEELLSHYLGILLIVPLMIMLLRTRLDQRALAGLLMDGLLVMLPSMTILLVLSEQAAPQPQFARVLSLAPVLFFAFRHGWRGASLAMLITSLGMTLVDQHLGHAPSTAAATKVTMPEGYQPPGVFGIFSTGFFLRGDSKSSGLRCSGGGPSGMAILGSAPSGKDGAVSSGFCEAGGLGALPRGSHVNGFAGWSVFPGSEGGAGRVLAT